MSDALLLLGVNFTGLLGVILLLWGIATLIRDVSFIDAFWAFGMVLLAWGTAWQVGAGAPHARLLLGLVTLWGLRLGVHLFLRNHGQGEDFRYRAFRRRWGSRFWIVSLATVFLLQAALVWVVSVPVQVASLPVFA